MINVSDLSRFLYCPRAVYLADVLGVRVPESCEQGRGVVGHFVRRELAMRQARLISKVQSVGDFDVVLRLELDAVVQELPHIFAGKWKPVYEAYLPGVRVELSAELDILGDELSAMVEGIGFDKALEYVTPWRTEYPVESKSLNLKGRVDKIMRTDSLVPVEIKTGKPSDYGWEGDRVQVCGYGMLLEERFSHPVDYGVIEYTRDQGKKPVLLTEKLRRQVLITRDQLIEVLDGAAPPVCPHGQPKKCESCGLQDRCYSI